MPTATECGRPVPIIVVQDKHLTDPRHNLTFDMSDPIQIPPPEATMTSPTRSSLIRAAVVTVAGTALALVPLSAAQAKPDTSCQKAGMSTLRSLGLLDDVARDGLPIAAAVSFGVAPREGTDVAALPDPLPLSVVLADHRAGDESLFIYPWCE